MSKHAKQQGNVSLLLISILLVLIIGATFFFKNNLNLAKNQSPQPSPINPQPSLLPTPTSSGNLSTYTSQDLKISFQYPNSWTLREKDFSILIASYPTDIGENKQPTNQQIKMFIENGNLCQDTLDKEVIYGGCGEGKQMLNQILKKDTQQLNSGTLYTYVVKYPQDNSEQTRYYLVNGNNTLFISKQPEPSQFDLEFENIINSIKFL